MLCDLKWFEVAYDEYSLSEAGSPLGRVVLKSNQWRGYLGSGSNGQNLRAKAYPSKDAAMRALESEATARVLALLSDDAKHVLGAAGVL